MIEEAESVEQRYAYLSYASFFSNLICSFLLNNFHPSRYHSFLQELKGESRNVEEEEIGIKGF